MTMRQRCAVLLLAAAASAAPLRPMAAEGETILAGKPVIPLLHARWLVKDGVPPNIQAMAQTPDGWIWMATPIGLFRFDGVSFARYEPPAGTTIPGNILNLGTLDDGTLWIAPKFGSLYLLRDQKWRRFERSEHHFPVDAIADVMRDRDGGLWVASGMGLFRLDADGRTWRRMNAEVGLPQGGVQSLLVDKRDTMWVLGTQAAFSRGKGAGRFQRIAEQQGWGHLLEAPDGTIWASDMGADGMRRLWTSHDDPRHHLVMREDISVESFTIDRRGNFWFPMYGGLARAELDRKDPAIQGYSAQQGLSGQHANVVFEDREGNVWVATDSGLDQFRPSRMQELALPPYLSEARPLLAGPDGDLWIDHVHLRGVHAAPQAFGPASQQDTLVSVLYRDPHGVVWCGALDGLWRLDGLARRKVELPPEFRQHRRVPLFALAMDPEDGLWISLGPRGTWRLKDGTWTAHGGVAALDGFAAATIVRGADGSLWFGSVGGKLAVLRNASVHKFGPADGIDVGTILQIVPQDRGAYIGGEDGLAFFDGRRARRIRGEGGELFPGTSGLVVTPDGSLWAHTGRGLIGIAASELARASADAAYTVRYRRFDENDGLKGTAPQLVPLPSMVRASTGELVMSTTSSVFVFDPARHATNTVVPPVHITAVTAGGKAHAPVAGLALPPAPDSVRIDYTALSFALPHRVRFQYMLAGEDRDWQDAGTRRSAFYGRLAPGRYTFKVRAANDDGLWNEDGAQLAFEVPPTATQTTWFKLLCVALAALVVWGLHRLRMRVAVRRLTMAFEARVAERERIARDLHDTLLQSVQGLILVFRRIAKRTPDSEPSKAMMNDALAMATEVMEEGRDKVGGLRFAGFDGRDLGAALERFGQRIADQHSGTFTLTRQGESRSLHGAVFDELLTIGREGIRNAFVHACPSHVDVELAYDERGVTLCVRDDGAGIPAELQMGRPGHWGIAGMRERARQLGATISLSSAPGKGTAWRLHLPAQLAYAAQPRDAEETVAAGETEGRRY